MESNWVNTEIANARQRGHSEGLRRLFPISILPFEAIQWRCFDSDTGIGPARYGRVADRGLVAPEGARCVTEFGKLVRGLKADPRTQDQAADAG